MRRCLLVALALGCASPRPAPAAPAPQRDLVADVRAALLANRLDDAAALVARARHASPELVAYLDATVHAYRQDFAGAAEVLTAYLRTLPPGAPAAFRFHDAMIALRTVDGDLLAALAECEEMVRAGELGRWKPDGTPLATLTKLKQRWHRAYLLRMAAQQRGGRERAALVAYAEAARRDYAALATPLALTDSIAVLDAYFAFCDGDASGMRAAAARVHVADDDDVEDLYLVQLALAASGAEADAAAIRTRMRTLPPTLLTPVLLAWLARDAETRGFSPRQPSQVASPSMTSQNNRARSTHYETSRTMRLQASRGMNIHSVRR